MMNTKLMGALGEYTAARKLREDGYDIYSTNFATPVGEIDIVAHRKGLLCFVEVKLRSENSIALPREFVDSRKQERLRMAAAAYLSQHELDAPVRFDVAEVYAQTDGTLRVEYLENAFE